jgi:drug/metabolite transporter (DMT)-like permease
MALVSAALFGASTPFAKLPLSGGLDPWLLAGLLYLGSGLGLGLVHFVRRDLDVPAPEAPPRRLDLPWLGLVVLSGAYSAQCS